MLYPPELRAHIVPPLILNYSQLRKPSLFLLPSAKLYQNPFVCLPISRLLAYSVACRLNFSSPSLLQPSRYIHLRPSRNSSPSCSIAVFSQCPLQRHPRFELRTIPLSHRRHRSFPRDRYADAFTVRNLTTGTICYRPLMATVTRSPKLVQPLNIKSRWCCMIKAWAPDVLRAARFVVLTARVPPAVGRLRDSSHGQLAGLALAAMAPWLPAMAVVFGRTLPAYFLAVPADLFLKAASSGCGERQNYDRRRDRPPPSRHQRKPVCIQSRIRSHPARPANRGRVTEETLRSGQLYA
jgi:hypothetical protein